MFYTDDSVLYLHTVPQMGRQGTPQIKTMKAPPARRMRAAATSRPWEMKAAVTRTPAPSLLPKWLRAGKLSQGNSAIPHRTHHSQVSVSNTLLPAPHFLVLSLMIGLQTSRVSVSNNIPQVEQHDILNSLLVLTLGLTYIPVPSKTWYQVCFA